MATQPTALLQVSKDYAETLLRECEPDLPQLEDDLSLREEELEEEGEHMEAGECWGHPEQRVLQNLHEQDVVLQERVDETPHQLLVEALWLRGTLEIPFPRGADRLVVDHVADLGDGQLLVAG